MSDQLRESTAAELRDPNHIAIERRACFFCGRDMWKPETADPEAKCEECWPGGCTLAADEPVITVLNDEVTVSLDGADYQGELLTSLWGAVRDDEGERIFELVLTMQVDRSTRVLTFGARISDELLDRLPSIFAAHALR